MKRRFGNGSMMRALALPLAAAWFSFAGVPSSASAQENDRRDPAAAEILFDQGRALMDAGKVGPACEKFEASLKADRAPGTLLNLGGCNRLLGKTATAWGHFVEAERLLKARGDFKRAGFAKQQATELESTLPRLTITSGASSPPGRVVKRDTIELAEGSFGIPLPVDPGSHEITIEAPGYRKLTLPLDLSPREQKSLELPALAPLPKLETGGSLSTGDEANAGEAQRVAGWVVGGVGVAALVTGAVFIGLVADRKSAADEECPEQQCTANGFDLVGQAETYANVVNVTLPVGGAAVVTGVILLLTAPSGDVALGGVGTAVAIPF